MAVSLPVPESNTLLAALPPRIRKQCLSLCEPFEMEFGAVLCDVETPYQHAYFPTSGLISLVSGLHDHTPLEMALIGQDGMLGATLLLGINTAPIRAVVHAPGLALRITVGNLQQQMRDSAALRKILSRYLYMRLVELSLVGGCIRYHRIEQRLARALLLAHDGSRDDSFYLTHGYLADMLGVRRSSITIAAGDLQGRKLISYTRGNIRMLDRLGLEAMSCECYEVLQTRRDV
ncbi:MAG: Crp/Fnr family transcriptional regulator [Gammaproteobacteria bacterium]